MYPVTNLSVNVTVYDVLSLSQTISHVASRILYMSRSGPIFSSIRSSPVGPTLILDRS